MNILLLLSISNNSPGMSLNWLQASLCWVKATKVVVPWTLWKTSVCPSLHLKHTHWFLQEAISLFQSIYSIDEGQVIYDLPTPTGSVRTGNQNQIAHLIMKHCLGLKIRNSSRTIWGCLCHVATCIKFSGDRKAGPEPLKITRFVSLLNLANSDSLHTWH